MSQAATREIRTAFWADWDRKLIWIATDTGLDLLTSPDSGEPVLEAITIVWWARRGLNEIAN